jgi:hypothetical protein
MLPIGIVKSILSIVPRVYGLANLMLSAGPCHLKTVGEFRAETFILNWLLLKQVLPIALFYL